MCRVGDCSNFGVEMIKYSSEKTIKKTKWNFCPLVLFPFIFVALLLVILCRIDIKSIIFHIIILMGWGCFHQCKLSFIVLKICIKKKTEKEKNRKFEFRNWIRFYMKESLYKVVKLRKFWDYFYCVFYICVSFFSFPPNKNRNKKKNKKNDWDFTTNK